jgi:hypothetical protein
VGQHRRPDHRPHLPLLLTHVRTGSLAGLGHHHQDRLPPHRRVSGVCPPRLAILRKCTDRNAGQAG